MGRDKRKGKTVKGGKAPGFEYWGKRPMSGSSPGSWAKSVTHKIERQRNKPTPKDFDV